MKFHLEFCDKEVKKKALILPMLLLTMATVPFPAMAATYTTEVTNNIFMGDINISLNEFEHDGDGNEVKYKDGKIVVPGERIDKIIRITNNANKAWVRAKLEYSSLENFQGLSDDDIELASDKWVKKGDYYYYVEPIDANKSIDLIKAVNIPTDWEEDRSNGIFQIFTSVDAVQTANFTPDFSSDDPWFGTVIEECVHTDSNVKMDSTQNSFSVVFEGGAAGIVKVGDDFFSNWASLMPGDTVSDRVTIGNNYSRGVYIFFNTETIANDDLLKVVHLTIKNGDTILFDGTMDGTIGNEINLGYFAKGKATDITYTLSIPAELTNKYALANTKTKWIFKCYYNNNSGGSGGSSSVTGSKAVNTSAITPTIEETTAPTEPTLETPVEPAPTSPKPKSTGIPRLGENKTTLLAVIGGVLVVLCGSAAMLKKKSDEEESRENKN